MSQVSISVENLSKRYVIGHQAGQRERYAALRDVIEREARNFLRKTSDLFHGRQIVQGDEVEEFWALREVSFEVKEGEVVGIIGPNGAGKSTLLKILSRITEPTEGLVRLRGRVSSLLEVGTGFHQELTGRENIFLNGAILGMTQRDIRKRFDEITAFADIENFIDTPVKRYSSGMYVRLAFAVAAHLEPDILVVDEVLAVGDAAFQKKCLGKIQGVAKGGTTVLFVSHNMGAIGTLCQRTAYIDNGRLQAIGATREIIPTYLSKAFESQGDSIDRLRAPGSGEKVRFSSIKLLGRDGATLRFGDPLEYSLSIRADVRVSDVSIGSGIFDHAGSCIGTMCTEETFSLEPDEELNLRLIIRNLSLAPGTYYGGFSIGYGGLQSPRDELDVIIGAPVFQIMPIASEDKMIANWHPNWGSIVISQFELKIEGRKSPRARCSSALSA